MSDNEEKVVCSSCVYDCGGRCPLQFHVKDGIITKVEPLKGEIGEVYKPCAKGRAIRQMIYNPNRLKYPLKRVGARGEGEFERVSWDEALDIVAGKLLEVKEKYGNSAMLYVNSGGSHGILHGPRVGYRFFHMFGGCTNTWGLASFQGLAYSTLLTYGERPLGGSWESLLNSKLIILWGFNPADLKFDSLDYYLAKAKAAGIKIVALDPRYTNSVASFARQWIPIYPSTDTAMLIAMAYVIIKEKLQDQKFIDTATVGFKQYQDYVLGLEDGIPKTPAWAESITGVPATTIESLAREYAGAKPAALMTGWVPGRIAHGEQFHRAAQVLAAITGNIGIPGGWAAELNFPPALTGIPAGRNPVEEGKPFLKHYQLKGIGVPTVSSARIHVWDTWDAILRGKGGGYPADIKLMYCAMANPLSNLIADTYTGIEALEKLDFVVVHEMLMTATAKYADIILPVSSAFEREDAVASWMTGPYLYHLKKVIEPMNECKSDLQIFTELASRLGIKGYNDKTDDEWLREIIEKRLNIPDYEEFKRKGIYELGQPSAAFEKQISDPVNNPFHTTSGKIEIYSQTLADLNMPEELPAIPKYIEGWEGRSSSLAKKYPLQFISPHSKQRVHFQFEDVPWLRYIEPHALWINSVDAQARGISNGDLVRIFNDHGKTLVHAKVTERVMPGVVSLHHGMQFMPDKHGVDRGGDVNTLVGRRCTIGGSFICSQVLVQVEKV